MKAFDEYQEFTDQTARYPNIGSNITYPALGLTEEAGEVAGKVSKIIRDQDGTLSLEMRISIAKELGDVLWYLARLAREIGIPLSKIAELNVVKLKSRHLRNRIRGSGDNR